MPVAQRPVSPRAIVVALLVLGAGCAGNGPPAAAPWQPSYAPVSAADPGARVVLVTIDGVRWQEVFRGADPAMLTAAQRAPSSPLAALAKADPHDARRALLPFVWDTLAKQGQIFGNLDKGSAVRVSNPHRVSYPGYHELLTGVARLSIVDNRRLPNPDVTVLEWLHRRPGFAGSVAAYAAWDRFPFIINEGRSGIPVSRWPDAGLSAQEDLNRLQDLPPWKDSVYDTFVFEAALRFLQRHRPRVLYIALGDTDEWAHAGRYDRYLEALQRCDAWLRQLWQTLESLPAYRGRTNLIISTDHGRGAEGETWKKHNAGTPGSEQAWVAALGPGVPVAGERRDHPPVTLAQVAATIGLLAGEDYAAAMTGSASPLPLQPPGSSP
jgi:hypothetical protein